MKLAQNQAKAKQHPETELLLTEFFSLFHPRYHPKVITDILKIIQKVSASVLMRYYD